MADPCRIRSEELLNKKTTAHGLSAIPQDRKKSYILCLKTDVPAGQNTSREEGERSPKRQQTPDSIPTNARLHCKQCLPARRLTPVCNITKHLLPHGTYSSDYKILTFYKTEAVTFGTDSIPKTEENRPSGRHSCMEVVKNMNNIRRTEPELHPLSADTKDTGSGRSHASTANREIRRQHRP